MHSNKLLAVLVGLVTAATMAVTSWIIGSSGALQSATASGGAALGIAAIIIHIGCVVVFGLVCGNRIKARSYFAATLCGLMMLGGALYSGWQIAAFATAELISATRAREADERRVDEAHKAQLDMAKERQKLQAEMAKGQLKWFQGTAHRDAEGRREKKDAMEAAGKMIADIGKGAPERAAPTPPQGPQAPQTRGEAFAVWMADTWRWDRAAVQAAPTLWLAFMMLLVEVIGWPTTAYLWAAAPLPASATTMSPPAPTPLEPTPELKALPPPSPSPRVARDPGTIITVRPEPSQKWRALLDRIDFPPAGAHLWGERRDVESSKRSALRFLAWMGAHKESGYFTPERFNELYQEFCAADHRKPLDTPPVKTSLKAIGDPKVADNHLGPAGPIWAIVPPSVDKMVALLEKGGVLPPSETHKAPPEPPTPARQAIAAKAADNSEPAHSSNVVALPPRKSGTAT